jgi:hypothetical protein
MGSAIGSAFRDASEFKPAVKDIEDLSIAVERVFHEKMHNVSDLLNPYDSQGKLSKGLGHMAQFQQDITGISALHDNLAKVTAVTVQKALYEKARAFVDGSLSKTDLNKMAQSGISREMAARIVRQFETHGVTNTHFPVSNLASWSDVEAKELYNAVIRKEVNTLITQPNATHKPLWLDSNVGKVINQFRPFMLADHWMSLISAGQQHDAAAYGAIASMLALGYFQVGLRAWVQGERLPETSEEWLAKAFKETQIATLPMMIDSFVTGASQGRYGFIPWVTDKEVSGFGKNRDMNPMGAFLGPTAGAVQSAYQTAANAVTDNFTYKDIHNIRSLIPFQNMLYINRALNNVEEYMTDYLGVPANPRPREPFDLYGAITKQGK